MAYSDITTLPGGWRTASTRAAALPLVEKILVVLGFLIMTGVVRYILPGGGGGPADDRSDGSLFFQLVSGGTYLAAIVILIYHRIPRWAFRLLLLALPLVLVTLLPLFSTLWSQGPDATFRRAAALILTSLFALYLVIRVEPKIMFNLLALSFAIFLGLSILAVLTGDGVTGGGSYTGAWLGISGNKNNFGRTAAVLVAMVPTAAAVGLITWRRSAVLLSLAGICALVLSQSATSLVSAFAAIGGGLLIYVLCGGRLFGWRFRGGIRAVAAIVIIIALAFAVIALLPLALEALGRDPTLTGRTKLWEWAISINWDRWVLGSGYRSFWIDANTRYFFETFAWNKTLDGALSDSYSGPTHAHSGYVDIWLELGLVGAILYALMVISALVTLSKALKNGQFVIGYMFAVMIAFLHVYAITARSILQQSEDVWFMFVLLYLLTLKATLTMPTHFATPVRRFFAHRSDTATTASSQLSAS